MSTGSFLMRKCQVPGCGIDSSIVIVYSAKYSTDSEKYNRWRNILNLSDVKPYIYACQRHFPAGAPTRNHPDPDIKLFNPIPKQNSLNDIPAVKETSLIFLQRKAESLIEKSSLVAAPPPPGSVLKLAPNATLIDLKKIREKKSFNKPIRIEEVTVVIDDDDQVKVVDFGLQEKLNEAKIKNGLAKRLNSYVEEDDEYFDDFIKREGANCSELGYEHSLGFTLDKMRQCRIDCNLALSDSSKKKLVYAHRAVLVARSPYFYRQIYLKRKKRKLLQEFCKFSLPVKVDHDILESVISYMYTDCLSSLLEKKTESVTELLTLFEMKDTLEKFTKEIKIKQAEVDAQITSNIKVEPIDDNLSVMVMQLNETESTPVVEVSERRPDVEKKKRKRMADSPGVGEEYNKGKFKVSVQKIVDSTLNPFLEKFNELFNPLSATFQIAETSQHLITLWHTDILLTKMFEQNDLTSFFSDIMGKILEKNAIQIKVKNNSSGNDPGAFKVETYYTQTGLPTIDDAYTKPYMYSGIDGLIEPPRHVVSDVEIQDYIDTKHVPKFVHLIALYRYFVKMKSREEITVKRENCSSKDSLIPSLIENNVIEVTANDQGDNLETLVKGINQNDQNLNGVSVHNAVFQQVNVDLKRRIVSDLELYVNPQFHEELIMHLIVDQMNPQNILPFTMGIFLAKGCNFCRKKECKSEDLSIPITPDNPVCPDRQCIKKNLQCNICNKQMSTSKSLARHKYGVHDIDTGDMSGVFICSHCGNTFSKKWKLNIHEREHEDKKLLLTCKYCKKKIRGSIALKKHISKVHEAIPQYSCEYCNKVFKRKETLSVHRRIHTGEKPFICCECDYASETKGNLKAHIVRRHRVQSLPYSSSNTLQHNIKHNKHYVKNQAVRHIVDNTLHHQQAVLDPQSQHALSDHSQAVIHEEGVSNPATDDQVIAATIVAHSFSDGSFIITSGKDSVSPGVP